MAPIFFAWLFLWGAIWFVLCCALISSWCLLCPVDCDISDIPFIAIAAEEATWKFWLSVRAKIAACYLSQPCLNLLFWRWRYCHILCFWLCYNNSISSNIFLEGWLVNISSFLHLLTIFAARGACQKHHEMQVLHTYLITHPYTAHVYIL